MRFGESYIRLYARSYGRSNARLHDYRSYDYSIIIAFFFGVSSDKRVIVKSYLQLGKKPFNPIKETRRKPVLFNNTKNLLAP